MKKELFVALESRDLGKIESLHEQDSKVLLEVTFQRDTPLHIAAREGHQDIVEWILKEKPSLARIKNEDGNTPLHEAAKCGNPDVVRILLEHKKISAYLYNKFRETALVIASKYGLLESVKLLLKAKEYNEAKEMQQSLRVAAYRGYSDIVKAIIGKPLKPPSVSPFYRLLRLLDTGVAEVDSIKWVLLGLFRSTGVTLNLHAAVRGGHVEIVEAILDSPAWDNDLIAEEDECGRCPIHVAAIKGSWDIINLFVDKMPDCLEIKSSDHKSVLHFAVEYNQIQIVQNLLERKSPKKAIELVSHDHDSSHNTAIHLAAKNGVDPEVHSAHILACSMGPYKPPKLHFLRFAKQKI